jgi:hypothetical protein
MLIIIPDTVLRLTYFDIFCERSIVRLCVGHTRRLAENQEVKNSSIEQGGIECQVAGSSLYKHNNLVFSKGLFTSALELGTKSQEPGVLEARSTGINRGTRSWMYWEREYWELGAGSWERVLISGVLLRGFQFVKGK